MYSTHSTQSEIEYDIAFQNRVLRDFHERCRTKERVSLCNLTQKAKEKFTEQILLKHFTEQFYQDGTMPEENPNIALIETAADNVSARYNKKARNCFVTINPREEHSLTELRTAVEKFISKPVVTSYFYVYEVRKGTTGLHCHMLITYAGRPNNFLRGLKNAFKHLCNSDNSHILNTKFISDELLQDKIKYMQGEKKKSKLSGVSDTLKYRKDNNLLPYYSDLPSCKVTQLPLELVD